MYILLENKFYGLRERDINIKFMDLNKNLLYIV